MELSFQQRMKEVEERFSVSQESVEKRFQADVLRLERDYQVELQALSESHAELRLGWEAQLQEAMESVEKERRLAEETVERLDQRREEDQRELERRHEEKVKGLAAMNQQLRQEVDALAGEAQTKEIELSRQLNELHGRLQESLEARDQLLAQFEETKKSELLIREKMERERDDLKVKAEELETLLRQAAVDFELERKELQEEVTILEKRLKGVPESGEQELVPGDALRNGLDQVLSPVEEANMLDEEEKSIDDLKVQDVQDGIHEGRNDASGEVTDPAASEDELLIKDEDLLPDGHHDAGGDAETCRSPGILSTASCEDLGGSDTDASSRSAPTQIPCERDAGDQQSKGENVDGDGENGEAPESCGQERKPQDVPALEDNGARPEGERSHGTAVGTRGPRESRDPAEMFPLDFEVPCSSRDSHERRPEAEPPAAAAAAAEGESARDGVKPPDRGGDCDGGGCPLVALQLLYNTAVGENVLLREKTSLLQQKTEVLEELLAQSADKIQAGRLALEENHGLKVQVLLLLEHVRELELKALGVKHLQVRYEDRTLENARLRCQNRQLERRIWSLEDQPGGLYHLQKDLKVDESAGVRGEKVEGRGFLADLGGGGGGDEVEVGPAEDLQGCCSQLERQNSGLRRALSDLQDQSQALDRSTLAQR